ncbi:hypothetical protein KP509_07G026500 [Ceratopteris richardii]|uniref:Uncharacterized protein n=1 Tax=Ceratopteris richardii TaxID=49495 RepID=A0A8T2U9J1_CERRI|nr:hypothetical protein KP509_07G026500 [Ceratopteris richardii]
MKLPDNFVHDMLEFCIVKDAEQYDKNDRNHVCTNRSAKMNWKQYESEYESLTNIQELHLALLTFFLMTHPVSYSKQAKAKFTEACVHKESNIQNLGDQDPILTPTIAAGVKKVTFGSIVVLYSINLLICLFAASFILSSCIVHGFV